MSMLCPECMGPLETSDGQTARCTIHGGQYQVLFMRTPPQPQIISEPAPPLMASEVPPQLEAGAVCRKHSAVPAVVACARCGTPMCDTCSFPGFNGRQVCLDCIPHEPRSTVASPPPLPAVQIPAGAVCLQHRDVAATNVCKRCGAYVCATCDFTFPGNIHLCPTCATAPQDALSPKRKKQVITSFVLAAVSTFGMALVFSGALRGLDHKERVAIAGFVLMFLGLFPALAGMAFGISAKSRSNPNPISLWIAIIWNSAIVGIYVLLCIIGLTKG